MKLPQLFSKKTKETKKYLALLLSDSSVRAALVEVQEMGVHVLSQSLSHTYVDRKDCAIKADESLQELSDEAEHVDEVIFALEANWVTEDGIADERKPLLKELTTDLTLKAVGFVVIPEAIVQGYQQQGHGFSALLAEVGHEKVSLYLVHQGIIEKAETVGRSHQHTGDLLEGIARFTQELKAHSKLPGQMILTSFEVDKDDLEAMRQELLSADWAKHEVFLQQPVIQVLAADEVTNMVAVKAGEAVARAQGMSPGATATQPVQKPIAIETRPTSFGVPISAAAIPEISPEETEIELSNDELLTQQQKKQKMIKMIVAAVVAGIIVLFIIAFVFISQTAKAQVIITPKLTAISKEVEVTVDPDLPESNPESMILVGRSVSTTLSGEDSVASTGRKVVGDPAKGEITLYNKTDSDKTFNSGTTVKAGNLEYTLDKEVTVDAAVVTQKTGGADVDYGEAKVTVTAKEIGEEGNIKKEVELSVASFASSSYEAISNADFTGGSSREVKVISEEDKTKVLTDLKAELLKKGQEQLESEVESGKYILPTTDITVSQAQYSAEVGTEASEVKLTLQAEVKALSYTAEDLRPIATSALQSEIPEGFVLVEDEPQVLSAPQEQVASGSAQRLTLNISSQAKAQFAEESIEQEIMGSSVTDAKSKLEANKNIQSVEIKLLPALAATFGVKVPKNAEKVLVEIQ